MMKILGISGLHASEPFQRQQWPNLEERYYRIIQGLDAAAALIIDGQIVACAAEERFTRKKGTGCFPIQAIRYCLQQANIDFMELDKIVHGFNYEPYRQLLMQSNPIWYQQVAARQAQLALLANYCGWSPESGIEFIQVPHHLAHAASSYYLSGFDQALVMVADGMGETQSLSLMLGTDSTLTILKEIPDVFSLGVFYSLLTLYLGFNVNADECKVMGLAAYGNPNTYFHKLMNLIQLLGAGQYSIPLLLKNETLEQQATYEKTLAELISLFGPARKPGDMVTKTHQDIAAALQMVLYEVFAHILSFYRSSTQRHHLCLAGGVALNCMVNAKIRRSALFDKIFIQPAAGDDGTALGAALYIDRQTNASVLSASTMPYFGPSFSDEAVASLIPDYPHLLFEIIAEETQLWNSVAARIARGEIVGWFQGRMEYGPRALGNRSILADPRDRKVRDVLNERIKQRESFRPFAPAVLIEDALDIFDIDPRYIQEYKYMLYTADVRPRYQSQLSAVTHIDGSARVQVVSKRDNPMFWGLLNAFKRITGLPVLLNTSFNINQQPIVCQPAEALATFELAKLDSLVIGHHLIIRI